MCYVFSRILHLNLLLLVYLLYALLSWKTSDATRWVSRFVRSTPKLFAYLQNGLCTPKITNCSQMHSRKIYCISFLWTHSEFALSNEECEALQLAWHQDSIFHFGEIKWCSGCRGNRFNQNLHQMRWNTYNELKCQMEWIYGEASLNSFYVLSDCIKYRNERFLLGAKSCTVSLWTCGCTLRSQ